MKKFLSVLLMVAGLMSCGDDDKPFIPELNKLTMLHVRKTEMLFLTRISLMTRTSKSIGLY